jgi:hypothetical protein
MTTNKISLFYIGLDAVLIIVSIAFGGYWLLNTQIAFICSMLIVLGSFFSYKKLVEKKIEDGHRGEERALLDKIDDKYELYDADEETLNEDLSAEEFKEIYKQERKKVGGAKKSLSNMFSSWSGALGVFRLFAYFILFVSVLVLIRKELFEPIAFLVGLGVVPMASLLLSFGIKN